MKNAVPCDAEIEFERQLKRYQTVLAGSPTQAQTRYAKDCLKKASLTRLDTWISKKPAYIQKFSRVIEPNISDEIIAEMGSQLNNWERGPRHLQDWEHEDGGFNEAAVEKQVLTGGRARGAQQADEKAERYAELRTRYPDLVGKRGAAKTAAARERKRLGGIETADEYVFSERMYRDIFKK